MFLGDAVGYGPNPNECIDILRACYAIIDDEEVEIVRILYDIESVQKKMRKELLPSPLIERLSIGG